MQSVVAPRTARYVLMPGVVRSKKDQHCAGALIFLEAQERPNQMMRIAERIGCYDPSQLDINFPVVRSTEEFVEMMEERG